MAPNDDTEPTEEARAPRGRRRRWWRSRALFVLGVVACVAPLLLAPRPSKRTVLIRLDDPPTVTRVRLAWSEGEESLAESTLHYAPGAAPSTIGASVTLPDGSYQLELEIQRGRTQRATTSRVEFRGDEAETTIFGR